MLECAPEGLTMRDFAFGFAFFFPEPLAEGLT
jgi:hypothetical protein